MTRIWIDCESRGLVPVTIHGVHAHVADPTLRVLSLHWAVDDGPVQRWRGAFAPGIEDTDPPPDELFELVRAGAELVAWNSAYDELLLAGPAGRAIGWPRTDPEQWLDAAFWSRSHNLPGELASASKQLLPSWQQKRGSETFRLLWDARNALLEIDRPHFEAMIFYGDADVEAMREICRMLPPLSEAAVADFHASERINRRGIAIARRWVTFAADAAPKALASLEADLDELTEGAVSSVKSPKVRAWVVEQLVAGGLTSDEIDSLLQKVARRRDPDTLGWRSETRPSFDREARQALRRALEPDEDGEEPLHIPEAVRDRILPVLDVVDAGAGAAAAKYAAMLNMTSGVPDDRLRGLFIAAGASGTGRFSSAKVQSQNLVRERVADPLDLDEHGKPKPAHPAAVSDWMRTSPRSLREVRERWGIPMHALLGRMLRPSLIAPEGRAFVWGDWSGIEARTLPWLTADPRAEGVLDLFQEGGDVYLQAASEIFNQQVTDLKDPRRRVGKTAVLALGYAGSVGAFRAMARSQGLAPMPDVEVRHIVEAWREANAWAPAWWRDLEDAARAALDRPEAIFETGCAALMFAPGLLTCNARHGALVATLPDGRMLFYPEARLCKVETPFGAMKWSVVYRNPRNGLDVLYGGRLAENLTQGTAASLLRDCLRRLETDPGPGETVLHVHDDIVRECDEAAIDAALAHLRAAMLQVPDWAAGLPLDVEVAWGWSCGTPERDEADDAAA